MTLRRAGFCQRQLISEGGAGSCADGSRSAPALVRRRTNLWPEYDLSCIAVPPGLSRSFFSALSRARFCQDVGFFVARRIEMVRAVRPHELSRRFEGKPDLAPENECAVQVAKPDLFCCAQCHGDNCIQRAGERQGKRPAWPGPSFFCP